MAPEALRGNDSLFLRDQVHGGRMYKLFAAHVAPQDICRCTGQHLDISWSFLGSLPIRPKSGSETDKSNIVLFYASAALLDTLQLF
jgi:hypothetical protein